MEEIADLSEDLIHKSQNILGRGGLFSEKIAGFAARSQQIQLTGDIAKAIANNTTLVVEAGTGTGKTYAYLVPALLSNKKVLISTATKTLQDQLYSKDIPELLKAMGLARRVQNLKGRQNYICKYRTELSADEAHFVSPDCIDEITLVKEKLPTLIFGEKTEIPEVSEKSPVWPYVTSTTENCLGSECPSFRDCFLVKARKKALEADVVVINHHLYFADAKLKDTGFGELLFNDATVIFDEAHSLHNVATGFYEVRLSSRQIIYLIDDILREWPILDIANTPLKRIKVNVEQEITDILYELPKRNDKSSFNDLVNTINILPKLTNLLKCLEETETLFADLDEENTGIKKVHERLLSTIENLQIFLKPSKNKILWVEHFAKSFILHATPFTIAEEFKKLLRSKDNAYIFTSATITAASSFTNFTNPLGLSDVSLQTYQSPFPMDENSILYLPRNLPDPNSKSYYEALVAVTLPIIEAMGGRTFFLFTSHRALNIVANMLSKYTRFPLLVQGDEAKTILINKFKESGNAVLLGTATFWEGVDVKGDALSLVIIDKIPFVNPSDPVIRAKIAYLKDEGKSGFEDISLPSAIIALKQGVGRLIRDYNDKGILVICDPRLTAREYGQRIFQSLPVSNKTRNEAKVIQFIETMNEQYEHTSN